MSAFQEGMSSKWSNAIGMYMALDWGLKCESLNPPYAHFHSPKTNGKVRFEIYFTNYFMDGDTAWISTEYIDTQSLGMSDYIVLCLWNKRNNNCVVLKTEDAVMLINNKKDKFPLGDLVPLIKRKFEIGVNKMEDADLSNDALSEL